MLDVKDQFPFFAAHPDLVYLDSASTTQKPASVIETLDDLYVRENANPGRGSYPLATQLITRVDKVRQSTADFVGVSKEEVFFNAGATDGFNRLALGYGLSELTDGDEILYHPADHASFVLPWFKLRDILRQKGINIKLVPYKVGENGCVLIDDIVAKLTDKTKVLNVTHVHNVYGTKNDLNAVSELIAGKDILFNVDGTQAVGHRKIDLSETKVDTYSFSGHKMFAATGVGVTVYRQEKKAAWLALFAGGGEGVELKGENLALRNLQSAYEAGTQNVAGIISLGTAIDFINDIGQAKIEQHLEEITIYLLEQLRTIPGLLYTPGPNFWRCKKGGVGTVAFYHKDIPVNELSFLLADQNIYVRGGGHCGASETGSLDSVRVSAHIYNDQSDVDQLIAALRSV